MHLQKSENIDVDTFDNELILMNLETRRVLVLNEAGNILWSALDLLKTRDALLDLLKEAKPEAPNSDLEGCLDLILDALLKGGFLHEVESQS